MISSLFWLMLMVAAIATSSYEPGASGLDTTINGIKVNVDKHALSDFISMRKDIDSKIMLDMNFELCKMRIWSYACERWKSHSGRLIARSKVKDCAFGLGWELLGSADVAKEGGMKFLERLRMDKEFAPDNDDSDGLKDRKLRIIGIIDWAIKKYAEEIAQQIQENDLVQLRALTQNA